jgi:hypothetical protein
VVAGDLGDLERDFDGRVLPGDFQVLDSRFHGHAAVWELFAMSRFSKDLPRGCYTASACSGSLDELSSHSRHQVGAQGRGVPAEDVSVGAAAAGPMAASGLIAATFPPSKPTPTSGRASIRAYSMSRRLANTASHLRACTTAAGAQLEQRRSPVAALPYIPCA